MKFYTDIVSDALTKSLKAHGCPIAQADMGFTLPQIIDLNPDYASVLDWLIEKGFNISIMDFKNDSKIIGRLEHSKLECSHTFAEDTFKETLEKIILLALDFIEYDV